ncbi:hypothetical protein [uncultured Roseibium sp.]|uniref:hypothetical protein n=1 Tax=uncultured Roseibium sp. TaxID=1936171 RepID=UPI002616341D|nr:hypothetical protein [uncultured Roseibium sp.]
MGGGSNAESVNPAQQQMALEHEQKMLGIERQEAELKLKAYEAEVETTLKELEREEELNAEKHETAMKAEDAKQAEFDREMQGHKPGQDEGPGETDGVNGRSTEQACSCEIDEDVSHDPVGNDETINSKSDVDGTTLPTTSAADEEADQTDASTVDDADDNPTITAELGDDGKWDITLENAPDDWFNSQNASGGSATSRNADPAAPSPMSEEWRSYFADLFSGEPKPASEFDPENPRDPDLVNSEPTMRPDHPESPPLH